MGLGRFLYSTTTRALLKVSRLRPVDLTVEGARVPAFTGGHGPRLLLLHGFGGDKEFWLPLTANLRGRFTTAAYDQPGFGSATDFDPRRAKTADAADHVAAVLDTLGWDDAHLCGHSMGGAISIAVAQRHPRRVQSLTLLAPAGPSVERSELDDDLDAGRNPLLPRSQEGFRQMMDFVAARQPKFPGVIWRHIGARQIERADRHEALFGVWHPDHRKRDWSAQALSEVSVPTLVISGLLDRVVHPATARALAERIPNAKLDELERIGHSPPLEAPRYTAKRLLEFAGQA